MKQLLIPILFLLIAAIGYAQSQSAPMNSVASKEIQPYIPAAAIDLASAKLMLISPKGEVSIIAWCERSAAKSDSSVVIIMAVEHNANGRNVSKKILVREAYSPSIQIRSDFSFKGNPVALVLTKYGAGAAQIDVIGADATGTHHLGAVEGSYFDFVVLDSQSYLVAHEDVNLFDVPKLYRWSGSAFVDDSKRHPEYYKSFLDELEKKSDVSKFASAVQQRYAKLRSLAGEPLDHAR